MSMAPFDHQLVIDRLQSQVTALQEIGGAAEYAAISDLGRFRTPSAYVLLAEEVADPKPAGYSGGTGQQRVSVTFGVALALRSYRDATGKAASDSLLAILGQVREALIGWTPDLPMARDCQLIKGALQDYNSNVLLWIDVYQTQHAIIRSNA